MDEVGKFVPCNYLLTIYRKADKAHLSARRMRCPAFRQHEAFQRRQTRFRSLLSQVALRLLKDSRTAAAVTSGQ